jgi:hypothetical protein
MFDAVARISTRGTLVTNATASSTLGPCSSASGSLEAKVLLIKKRGPRSRVLTAARAIKLLLLLEYRVSVAVYYSATRKVPLSQDEIDKVRAIAAQYAVDQRIEEYVHTRQGLNWESFDCRFNTKPGGGVKAVTILEGATKLPDNTEGAMWEGVQHWCECLSAIRRVIPDASWEVQLDDHPIKWDSALDAYDPRL